MRTLFITLVVSFPAEVWAAEAHIPPVKGWMVTPFVVLLVAIAVVPFINRGWWDRYYPHVSLGLGFAVFSYYTMALDLRRMLETAVDYLSFIALIGSLFVAAGGIYLHTERHATPLVNTILLSIGAVISNLLGTTGASMLLIRPFIRMNRQRIRGFHVVFFIFVVSNIGGALTPIGDPPLFLGYLNGVPFHWTILQMWNVWLLALALVLALFWVLDTVSYRRWLGEGHRPVRGTTFDLKGTHNFVFLLIILAAVFTHTPLREIIMVCAAAAAYRFADQKALRANEFTFAPIKEVAILFAGIFATMVPALDYLALNADRLGIKTPGAFYWATGILSSFLDNAPTYLNLLSAAMGLHGLVLGNTAHIRSLIASHGAFLRAISAGAVFFGASTYIGNGPNFMVKSIAEHARVDCPSFFGYMVEYSIPVLIPVFTVVWLVFFRS
ncbi:MAG: sodium:proton antiporter [Acidobacteria bacterium]|nr:sodium:proton antiporter [Acidobacteriota bacterium]